MNNLEQDYKDLMKCLKLFTHPDTVREKKERLCEIKTAIKIIKIN